MTSVNLYKKFAHEFENRYNAQEAELLKKIISQEHEKYEGLNTLHTVRLKASYIMDCNNEPPMPPFVSNFQLAVGKSGEAKLGEVVEIFDFSVDANLFIDEFKVESCLLGKKRCLKFNRCDTMVYFDKFMTCAILNVVEILNCCLDLLGAILFYDHYKGSLTKLGTIFKLY